MKTAKKGGKAPVNKVQKPQFKKNPSKGGKNSGTFNKNAVKGNQKGNKPGPGKRNQFTFAEEKRIEKIRLQNERKAEKEAKLLIAKKDKKRKLKIFSKKNNKGQPVMKGRMELLLEKIEKRVAK